MDINNKDTQTEPKFKVGDVLYLRKSDLKYYGKDRFIYYKVTIGRIEQSVNGKYQYYIKNSVYFLWHKEEDLFVYEYVKDIIQKFPKLH